MADVNLVNRKISSSAVAGANGPVTELLPGLQRLRRICNIATVDVVESNRKVKLTEAAVQVNAANLLGNSTKLQVRTKAHFFLINNQIFCTDIV